MNELLSISIPTRNRAKCLFDLLSDISLAIEYGKIDTSLLKIYIFDNASDDNTVESVDAFKAKLPIFYKRNEENIGMGLNIFQAYTAVNGEYVWVIGDDDLVPRGAISTILSLIQEHAPALIIPRERSYKGFVELPRAYPDFKAFARSMQDMNPHYLIAHSWISANVLRRAYFDSDACSAKIETYYGHMYGIASGLTKNVGPVILPKEETIRVRKNYLGPVDGFWPESIEREQVAYLEWLKNLLKLNIDPPNIVPEYREKIAPNIFMRKINFILYVFRKILRRIWDK